MDFAATQGGGLGGGGSGPEWRDGAGGALATIRSSSEDIATRSPSRCRSPPCKQAPARARLFPGRLSGLKGARLSITALRSRGSLLLRGPNAIVQRGLLTRQPWAARRPLREQAELMLRAKLAEVVCPTLPPLLRDGPRLEPRNAVAVPACSEVSFQLTPSTALAVARASISQVLNAQAPPCPSEVVALRKLHKAFSVASIRSSSVASIPSPGAWVKPSRCGSS